ncbi:MAG: hypothetical protein NC390_06225 [Fusobacterium sp.]|nr:hypothetical protein [Fusobacterium sp.]
MSAEQYKKLLLIDLDGVLNQYDGKFDEKQIPTIRNGAKEFLEHFHRQDYDIKIFTTRNKLLTAKWLIENDLDQFVSDVTNIKESAYLTIDDRCICFNGDFEKTCKQINDFKVHWK